MKRIVVFCDGTWNTPDKTKNGERCHTNVVKLANALSPLSKDGTEQLMYYDKGIGSEGIIIKKWIDGATGRGISKNIKEAYRFLINNYVPGDELFFFGFSRGSFTVRSLCGLIRNSGILRKDNIDKVSEAYCIYRSRKSMYQPREIEATLFRKTFAVEESTKIKFVGVWDTVGALGNPLYLKHIVTRKNMFHDTGLSSKINYAFHALSIDEKRKNFMPALWYKQPTSKDQVLEQVWFSGVHSDIGGGYPESESGLSDISLIWMLEKATQCNLEFLNIEIEKNPEQELHESRKGFYRLISRYFRPIGRENPDKGTTNESIHNSVIQRFEKNEKYRPKNLIDYLKHHPNNLSSA